MGRPGQWSGGDEHTILTAQQDSRAAHLRAEGRTYRQIAEELNVGVSTAYKSVQRAIAAVPVEAVNELRAVECARLDAVIARAWDIVHAEHAVVSYGRIMEGLQDSAPVLAALNLIRATGESKRKLLGLDAPTRRIVEVITEDVVDAELRQLDAEYAELTAASGDQAN